MIRHIVLAVLILMATAGCVRRDGSNTNCMWPGEASARKLSPNQAGYGRHLGSDAEFAEELADRYALKMARPGNLQVFVLARNRCLEEMFTEVARVHGVTPSEVSRYLGANRTLTDIALNLPFILLYVLASATVASGIWRRCPPSEGWLLGAVLVLLCSFVFGAIGVLLGEQWSTMMETFRIGTGHLGSRISRLPWARHGAALSACLMVLFCGVAAIERRFPNWRPGLPHGAVINLGVVEHNGDIASDA